MITAFQGAEAIKLLTGNEEACETHLRHIDLWSNHFQSLDVSHQKDEDCPACRSKQWDFLHPARKRRQEVSMCGRQSVQITLSQPLDLDILESRLQKVGKTNRNPFLLKADLSEDGHELASLSGRAHLGARNHGHSNGQSGGRPLCGHLKKERMDAAPYFLSTISTFPSFSITRINDWVPSSFPP